MPENAEPTFRRQVFFIGGFDPRGVLFHHKSLVQEADKWSSLTGRTVTVSGRKNVDKLVRRWTMTGDMPDGQVQTQFDFLQWDDIIRANWEKREWKVFLTAFGDVWDMIRSGVLRRSIRESWPIATVIVSPVAIVVLHVIGVLLPFLGLLGLFLMDGLAPKFASVALIGAGAALLAWVRKNMERYKPAWNARVAHFACLSAPGRDAVAGFDQKIDSMAAHIIASVDAAAPDEALIVGHSYGTLLAAQVTARILCRRPDWGERNSPLGLITLGHCHGLVGYRKTRTWYHEDLTVFRNFPNFSWLDFSSPGDGACYAMVNALDFLPDKPQDMPKQLNAQFHKILSRKHMNQARDDRMLMHFFYMHSPDKPDLAADSYDFILLLAGRQMARSRYGRRPSAKPYYARG